MAVSYATTADVYKLLPPDVPSEFSTNSHAWVVDAIESVSERINDRLGKFYATPFSGTTDPTITTSTLATPARINKITQYLTAHELREDMAMVQENMSTSSLYGNKAEKMLAEMDYRLDGNGNVIGDPLVRIEALWAPQAPGKLIQMKTGEDNETNDIYWVD